MPLPVPSTSFVERARQLGDLLRTRLERLRERFALVGEVRGLGPMLALELVRDRGTKEPATAETAVVLAACHRRGLIVNRAGLYDNVVRLLPAFVISDADVEQGLDILEAALAEVSEAFSSSNLSTQGDRNHAR
jgi:4-aminobutyrate aminotransferase/(S)-3-amino-2-methylpropionate transaminase